jgi:hypothetical protein
MGGLICSGHDFGGHGGEKTVLLPCKIAINYNVDSVIIGTCAIITFISGGKVNETLYFM